MNPTLNWPGALLGVWLVWFAITGTGLGSVFGILTLVTGIVWLVVSLGVIGRLR